MSYILDAIKKADQKRELGTVPDVHTIHEAPLAEARRPRWLYWLAAILLVNAGGIGWWLLWSGPAAKAPVAQSAPPTKPESAPGPAPQVAKNEPPRLATSGSATLMTRDKAAAVAQTGNATTVSVESSVPPPAATIEQAPAPVVSALPPPVPPVQDLTPPAGQVLVGRLEGVNAPPVSSPPPAVDQANAQAPVADAQEGPPASSQPVSPPPQEAPSAAVVPVIEAEQPENLAVATPEEPLSETAEAPPAPDVNAEAMPADEGLTPIASSPPSQRKAKKADQEEEDPELAKIPFLKQLPAEVQQTIPELHISFHSYSIKSSARLVSISGKIMHEGDEFDENLKLETITVKGVVLVFKGRRFRLNV